MGDQAELSAANQRSALPSGGGAVRANSICAIDRPQFGLLLAPTSAQNGKFSEADSERPLPRRLSAAAAFPSGKSIAPSHSFQGLASAANGEASAALKPKRKTTVDWPIRTKRISASAQVFSATIERKHAVPSQTITFRTKNSAEEEQRESLGMTP